MKNGDDGHDDDDLRDEIERFRNGDEDAAARIYRRLTMLAMGVIRRHLPARKDRPRIGSSDVRQEALRSFFSALQKPEFSPVQENILGLLVRIAQCKCALQFRRINREVKLDFDDYRLIVESAVAAGTDRVSIEERAVEWGELFDRVLQLLPEWQREVMTYVLDDEVDWTRDDIARACGRDRVEIDTAIEAFQAKLRMVLRRLRDEV